MDNATFFALFWGWLTLIMTAIYFLRPKVFHEVKTTIVENTGFRLIYGIASIMIGLASVILVNTWSLNWQGLVTLFGWLALAKGIVTLAWPEIAKRTPYKTRIISTRIALVIAACLAILLLVMVYTQ